jgi:nucleotide-binding universal stress UspA family protein
MFRHILLPTDGSSLSEAAVRCAVPFAKALGAQILGLCVIPEKKYYLYQTGVIVRSREQALIEHREEAGRYLQFIKTAAQVAAVPCEVCLDVSDYPHEAIIKVAERKGCDLVMMASHGRRGAQALLLGSETQKVLAHSKIPVLVVR